MKRLGKLRLSIETWKLENHATSVVGDNLTILLHIWKRYNWNGCEMASFAQKYYFRSEGKEHCVMAMADNLGGLCLVCQLVTDNMEQIFSKGRYV